MKLVRLKDGVFDRDCIDYITRRDDGTCFAEPRVYYSSEDASYWDRLVAAIDVTNWLYFKRESSEDCRGGKKREVQVYRLYAYA